MSDTQVTKKLTDSTVVQNSQAINEGSPVESNEITNNSKNQPVENFQKTENPIATSKIPEASIIDSQVLESNLKVSKSAVKQAKEEEENVQVVTKEKVLREEIVDDTQHFDSPTNMKNTIEVTPFELVIPKPTELSITTSVDWIAFLGFAITAMIILITNRQTVNHSTKLIESQEALSHSNAKENIQLTKSELTAVNRQSWINTLRDDLASFVGAMNSIWDLNRVKDGRAKVLAELNKPEYAMTELYDWSIKYNGSIQYAEGISAKIKLLVNPTEDNSKALCCLLDETMELVLLKKDPKDLNSKIIDISQKILKEEWERVKDLK